MRVAVYGGSFDPPHVGHAMVAAWLGWTRRVDAVWLVPTFQHAFAKQLAPFETRVALCQALARALGPHVQVSRVEETLERPSFTIQTLSALAEAHPEHAFQLVVGSDVLEQVDDWHRWDLIVERFRPLVVGRVGYEEVPGAPSFPPVSSTEVRRALRAGEDVSHLVPGPVLDLLEGVYR